MRLIDADAFEFNFQYGRDDNGILLVPLRDARKAIKAAKTVDALPVVRCRDCKHSYEDLGGLYCSYGRAWIAWCQRTFSANTENGGQAMANKNDMLEALEEIENGMIRIKEKRSIWQNSLVYALCQAVRLLLIDKIKEGRK